ncbi:TPA: DNA-binding transcriptional regulator YafC [Haemophilus influenzae]|jgi:transcriptional regulator, LysR family|uniref:LysR family transcriptional regulator n=3 Tax=Bacteria TaxID=2 RepID=A0A2R3G2H4_HAEIF|nr:MULTISPECIES: DNA-binding transcriptional regulator YafC [Haemophilus]EDJ90238.1 lysR-family transcriptional regulator [Haemophilus influenzae R3021]AIT67014.1 LysR family transcriptional regulator [Haemophilus influenzae]AVI99348.1 transcriptional regulator, LysR family [Haemophilus influenzae]AVJ01197.1 transcriptional regulator, LysR family [Haemophilus influenzae]AXP39205.1 LysR family transcriptional regulator [Haemophilus influenzae]
MKTTSEELTVFVQVVENGSFSRAAKQLSMANSAVSRVVKRLEEKLGVNLINRTTRQLRLTEEGLQYFRRVQKILQDMAAAEAEMLAVHEVPQGILRVDSAMPMVLHLLVPLAAKFNERYPHIQLSLVSSEGYINLIERKVDIALRAGELDDSGLRARHLFDSHFRVIASPDYLAKHGTPQSTEALANHQCLGFTEPSSLNTWTVLDAQGNPYKISPHFTASSGEILRSLCLSGCGIACLSDFLVDNDIAEGKLIPLLTEQTANKTLPFNAVYYSDKAVNLRLRVFLDFLVEELRG